MFNLIYSLISVKKDTQHEQLMYWCYFLWDVWRWGEDKHVCIWI